MTTAVIIPTSTATSEVKSSGFGTRLWKFLLGIGERRAADEVARYIRCRGGKPTGDISKDVEMMRTYVGIR